MKKPAANKIEKFLAERLQLKVDEILLDYKIQKKMESVANRINDRVARLERLKANPLNFDDL